MFPGYTDKKSNTAPDPASRLVRGINKPIATASSATPLAYV